MIIEGVFLVLIVIIIVTIAIKHRRK